MKTHHEVAIIGGGFAGVGAAIKLREAGISDFMLLEKASELGGVWRENTYPGCACDVPSALYSYSFAPNPRWSRLFAGQAEIKAYLQQTARDAGVLPHVQFRTELQEARWLNEDAVWQLATSQGTHTARFVIFAGGPMHEPRLPDVPGLDTFSGVAFHSSRWRHDVDLRGQRVAVIGTGASAIQFVPAIADNVAQLTVFQRTPHWVLPKLDPELPTPVHGLFRRLPTAQKALRGVTYGIFEALNGGMHHLAAMKSFQRLAEWNIRLGITDPQLRQQVTPNYVIGCKRVLQSSTWYPTLAKPHVSLVASGLNRIEGHRLIADNGQSTEVDVLIFGTGFEIAEPPIAQRIYTRRGDSLADVWQGSPEGFLGTTLADCPNAFLMFGPNSAVSSSAFLIIEAQLQYIVDALQQARARQLRSLVPAPQRVAAFNQRVQKALTNTVWNRGGCTSYFIDRNGRNSTLWPWTTWELKRQLRHCNLNDYLTEPAHT